ncbi:MAG: nucleotide exchange factor GrpE [Nitrospirae bacterium]|nr:nucleotide exchange factor GrpE [Nitrospirota bacterium]
MIEEEKENKELTEDTVYNNVDNPQKEGSEEKSIQKLEESLAESNDKYIRLYADFENYKRIAERNRQEFLKYANEGIIEDLLSVIDHLELALQHSSDEQNSQSLSKGVELTLKDFKSILEKYGLTSIEAKDKPFDPSVHHAISQIETDEVEENIVAKEHRRGYMLKDRLLRASLVEVSKKPSQAK